MTQFWANGQPIAVRCDANAALELIHWSNQWQPVTHIAQRWRVDAGWWRLRTWRDYFKLTTGNGVLLVVYHDLLTDTWHLQRIYD
ncbi:MAG: hypothetical protein M3R24_12160 [Chloroflexota bacterium]|nr:hypothetical protein [Chloroflexota bacterium]